MKKVKFQKRNKRLYAVLNAAVALAIALAALWAVAYGTGLAAGLVTGVTVDGEKVSAREVNYFFRDSYDDFRAAYSDIISAEGIINKTISLNKQEYSENYTWAQFIFDACRDTVCRTETVCLAAEKEGWTLPEDSAEEIEAQMSKLSQYAEANGMSLSAFLKSFYGKSATVKSYRQYLYRKALAESYSINRYNSFTITDEEADETALRDEAWSVWYDELAAKYPAKIHENVMKYLCYEP